MFLKAACFTHYSSQRLKDQQATMVDNGQACSCRKTVRQFLLQSPSLLRQKPLFLTSAGWLLLSEPIPSVIALINSIANLLMFLICRTLLPCISLWWGEGESAVYDWIQLVDSSVSNDLLRDEIWSQHVHQNTSPDWDPPIKICVPYLGLSVLRCPVGVTNTGRDKRKLWGYQKGELVLIMLMTALYQLISCSLPAVSIKTLHVVFSRSRCLPLLLKTEGSFL